MLLASLNSPCSSTEAAAAHEAAANEQKARGQLERQKLRSEMDVERETAHLLHLRSAAAAIESTGQAVAEARAQAERLHIEGQSEIEGEPITSLVYSRTGGLTDGLRLQVRGCDHKRKKSSSVLRCRRVPTRGKLRSSIADDKRSWRSRRPRSLQVSRYINVFDFKQDPCCVID